MKIAFVTDTYKPRINGVVTSIDAYAKILKEQGHDVSIIAPEYPGYHEQDENIVRMKSHYVFFDPEDRLANPWLPSSRKAV